MGSASSKVEEKCPKVKGGSGLIGKRGMVRDDHNEKERESTRVFSDTSIYIGASVPNAVEAEQVAAGWPSWLTEVASEAIQGWIPQHAYNFDKLEMIGKGTYSNVYKARDRDNNKIVALKKVRVDTSEPQSIKFMAREILILRRLDHQNIIKLEGVALSRMQYSLLLILEYMPGDLTRIISRPQDVFTERQVESYMHQLLSGIEHCHSRGVLHRDIKSTNILIDSLGRLKIADFGLSTFFYASTPLTSRVGTLWYRSPELLLGATHYGPAVDLWSTGCVLGELYIRKPIMPGKTEVEQLHKIFKLCGGPSDGYLRKPIFRNQRVMKNSNHYRRCFAEVFDSIPTEALGLLETLLSIDPDDRGTASSALRSEFFSSEPLASSSGGQPSNMSNVELVEDKAASSHAPLGAEVKRQDYDKKGSNKVRVRRAKSGLDATKLDHQGFVATATSSNVAQTLTRYDHIWGAVRETRERAEGEMEVHEHLLPADSQYAGPFGVSMADLSKFRQEKGDEGSSGTASSSVHDDHIQESTKKSSLEKLTFGKFRTQQRGAKLNTKPYNASVVAANKIDELLDEHDRQIQDAVQRSILDKKRLVKAQAQEM